MLDHYFNDVRKAVVYWNVIPYITFLFFQIWLMYDVLSYDDMKENYKENAFHTYVLTVPCLLSITYFIHIEIM